MAASPETLGLVMLQADPHAGRLDPVTQLAAVSDALASGAALVTSGLGGLAEVCGPDAVWVDPANAEDLDAALASLLDSPERRAALARAGRARVEALYDIRTVAKRMDDFVDEVVARRRA